MKIIIKLIFIILINSTFFTQSNWEPSYVNYYQNVRDVKFINPNTGWISLSRTSAGDWPRVLKTTNKGYNWTQIWCENAQDFAGIDLINENVGCLYAGNVIKKTYDDGNTWYDKYTCPQNLGEHRIRFVNSVTGYVLFNKGYSPTVGVTIYKTTNSGESWFIPNSAWENFESGQYTNYSVLRDLAASTSDVNFPVVGSLP